jgi:hypothetical protein
MCRVQVGDEVLRWPVQSWPLTVADLVAGGVGGYCDRVAAGAESILRILERAGV